MRLCVVALALPLVACSRANPRYAVDGTGADGGGSGGVNETSSTGGSTSLEAVCGNGELEGDEVCDDGVNDGSYEGCMAGCQALAPRCGDAIVDESFDEDCDDGDGDLTDGCLPTCTVPHSCLEIREVANAPEDGLYIIDPEGNLGEPLEVYCDMTTDGGGYTFYKIELDGGVFAPEAEDTCRQMGMQLWIPRTPDHRDSGLDVANDDGFGPSAGDSYLGIMGVYPQFAGATCANEPLNSSSPECDWRAGDDRIFWVDDHDLFDEPNGNDGATQVDGSLLYYWETGELTWYDDISGPGGMSSTFMCDVGDIP